jgi:hypothetical protein
MKLGLVLLAGLLCAACGSSGATLQATSTVTTDTVDHDAVALQMLVGTWVQGQDRLVLELDGTYLWERERACELPPCPIDQTSGSFEHRGQTLHLATVAGPELGLPYTIGSDPRRITVSHPDGRRWTLPFVE